MIDYFVPVVEESDRVKLSLPQQEDLVHGAVSEWDSWTQMIQEIRTRALEARQIYSENRPELLSYNKPDDSMDSARVRRPALAQAVDSTLAQQHLASFPSDERFFKGKPQNQIAADNLDRYEKHVERRLSAIDFLVNKLKDRKNLMLDGTSAVWHPFMRETVLTASYEPQRIMGIPVPGKFKTIKKEQVVFEGTGFVPLNFEDWRVDPLVDNMKDTPFIWRRWVSKDEVKSIKAFQNTDDMKSYNEVIASDVSGNNKQTNYRYMGINPTYKDNDCPLAGSMVLLYERWGDFYIDDKFYENHVLIFSNDRTFHYFGPNPYNHQKKPFTIGAYVTMPGTLYGKSLAQDIIPLCHALDGLLCKALDIINNTATPTFTYLTDDEALMEYFTGGKVSLVPGEGIPVQSHAAIQTLVWDQSALAQVEAMMQGLKEEIRESTGGVPYTTGGASVEDQRRTLGEVQILANGTNTRFQLFIQIDEESKQKPFLGMVFENDRQFMTENVFIDDDNIPLTVNTVKRMLLDFEITGSRTVMNRAKEAQDMDAFIGNYLPGLFKNQLATHNGDTCEFNVPELIKRRMVMAGFRDLDNLMEVKKGMPGPGEAPAVLPPQLGALPNGLPTIPGPQAGIPPRDMAAA